MVASVAGKSDQEGVSDGMVLVVLRIAPLSSSKVRRLGLRSTILRAECRMQSCTASRDDRCQQQNEQVISGKSGHARLSDVDFADLTGTKTGFKQG